MLKIIDRQILTINIRWFGRFRTWKIVRGFHRTWIAKFHNECFGSVGFGKSHSTRISNYPNISSISNNSVNLVRVNRCHFHLHSTISFISKNCIERSVNGRSTDTITDSTDQNRLFVKANHIPCKHRIPIKAVFDQETRKFQLEMETSHEQFRKRYAVYRKHWNNSRSIFLLSITCKVATNLSTNVCFWQ